MAKQGKRPVTAGEAPAPQISKEAAEKEAQVAQLVAFDRCVAVGGIIAARVNDQLQKVAASLPSPQDDLMDVYSISGSASHPGGATGAAKQGSGNIPVMSAQMGQQAMMSCLQRALGRGMNFEQLVDTMKAAGGPLELGETELGTLLTRKVPYNKNRAVSVPR